ncbi:MAG: hypothetical protein PHT02_01145 [Tissierellia bacterium]|nr:hypothetical protein [Tissierellia bacterium]
MQDCCTCEFAKRDNHNRFIDRCSGFGNCSYSKFEGEIKPTLEKYIESLSENLSNTNKDYLQGFNDALVFIKVWNDTENPYDLY